MGMRRWLFLSLTVVFILLFSIIIITPNQFQKFNSFVNDESYHASRVIRLDNSIQVEKFISNIPYKYGDKYVYSVLPVEKYKRTMLNGYGDCSTMSFGASYYLLMHNTSFEIVHFLPFDNLFNGSGHVVLRLPFQYKGADFVGILDLAGGGIVSRGGKLLDVFDLKDGSSDIDLIRLNPAANQYYSNYYKRKYLNKVSIGYTPCDEVETYFNFIEKYYFPLGNERLEKLFYDGLAIFFGHYYSIYVDNVFYSKYLLKIEFYRFILYYFRFYVIILFIAIAYEIVLYFRRS